ncbi:hypothetical protein RS83_02617 [Microbacterium oxydans]|uniref:Uncharacterized protein n=2 Tax=Microbacterium oxydans TaxID=82380 RepID=A0A0F0L352_9MICO|nr:hypothetical protein RS83_02617 [Microbacterium oxydans]
MDVFERVREVNAGAGLTEDRISGARSRLLDGIDAGRTAERKRLARRPMLVIAGAVATVAAVTATVVVINQPVAPAPRVEAVPVSPGDPRTPGERIPKPVPTVGTGATEVFPGTTPQPGQYLKITATEESIFYRDGNGGVNQWFSNFGTPPIAAAVMRGYSSTTMPADRSGEWISSRGPSSEFVQAFGADEGTLGSAWSSVLPYSPAVIESRSVGGLDYGYTPGVGGPNYYDAQPRDPQALWNYWYDFFSQAQSGREESVLYSILDVLKSNIAPADVRSAYLEALQTSGRAAVDSTNGSVVTYAVQFSDADARTERISIDTSTGWVMGYTIKYLNADGGLVPGGVPNVRVTYALSIVPSAQ